MTPEEEKQYRRVAAGAGESPWYVVGLVFAALDAERAAHAATKERVLELSRDLAEAQALVDEIGASRDRMQGTLDAMYVPG